MFTANSVLYKLCLSGIRLYCGMSMLQAMTKYFANIIAKRILHVDILPYNVRCGRLTT